MVRPYRFYHTNLAMIAGKRLLQAPDRRGSACAVPHLRKARDPQEAQGRCPDGIAAGGTSSVGRQEQHQVKGLAHLQGY